MRRVIRPGAVVRSLPGLAAGALVAGCTPHAQIAELMHDSWNVVREYEQSGYTYYVVQEGPRYAKIVQLPSGPVYTLYGIDTLTRTCKWEDIAIPCDRLRADPDLGRFVTWPGAVAPAPEQPIPPPLPAAPPAPGSATTSRPALPPPGPPAPAPPEPPAPPGSERPTRGF